MLFHNLNDLWFQWLKLLEIETGKKCCTNECEMENVLHALISNHRFVSLLNSLIVAIAPNPPNKLIEKLQNWNQLLLNTWNWFLNKRIPIIPQHFTFFHYPSGFIMFSFFVYSFLYFTGLGASIKEKKLYVKQCIIIIRINELLVYMLRISIGCKTKIINKLGTGRENAGETSYKTWIPIEFRVRSMCNIHP